MVMTQKVTPRASVFGTMMAAAVVAAVIFVMPGLACPPEELARIKAAEELAKENISAEIIDLRTLKPMDMATIIESVKKTGRVVTVEEGWRQSGVGAEIAASVTEHAFDWLDAPVTRVTGKDVPMPYAANLEKLALPSVAEVVAAAKTVCYR